MPTLGKELERQLTPDETALKEIQGYIDRVERQIETQKPQMSKPVQSPVGDQANISLSQPSSTQGMMGSLPVKKILLPLDRDGLERGLRFGIVEGVRWLSEWCVMMIKKYPGRVFYMPDSTS